jgi:hypothetical protein
MMIRATLSGAAVCGYLQPNDSLEQARVDYKPSGIWVSSAAARSAIFLGPGTD